MRKPPNPQVSKEKKRRWEETMEEANKITDTLGMPIDPGIKETVCALLVNGFSTSGSCEGHLDGRRAPYPWVEIGGLPPAGWEEAKGEERERLRKEWEERNRR